MFTTIIVLFFALAVWVLSRVRLFNFIPGHVLPVAFQVLGSGNVAVLNITGYTLDISVLLFDVTSTAAGGNTARLAGKRDAKGVINYDFDADYPPYLTPPNLVEGSRGVMLFYLSAPPFKSTAQVIQMPVIVEKMHFETAVTSQLKGSCDVSMESRAGLAVYPTF